MGTRASTRLSIYLHLNHGLPLPLKLCMSLGDRIVKVFSVVATWLFEFKPYGFLEKGNLVFGFFGFVCFNDVYLSVISKLCMYTVHGWC